METRNVYVIVSEGSSERAYIQQLRSFLAHKMPVCEDFRPRLDLIPKVTNNGSGGGQFQLVQQTYNRCRRIDRQTPVMIWVDVDIYVRNESAIEERNAKGYATRKGIPDFLFSVMNFEDFLALHFDDEVFEMWHERFSAAGHFNVPLHGSEHMPLFIKVWEEHANRHACRPYRKGDLPYDFISRRSLGNMIRHTRDPRVQSLFRAHTPSPTFPEFLSQCLTDRYPEEMSTASK